VDDAGSTKWNVIGKETAPSVTPSRAQTAARRVHKVIGMPFLRLPKTAFLSHLYIKNDHSAKTGSGQT
jgi:hypothetical protein